MLPAQHVWVRAVVGKPGQGNLPASAVPAEQSRAEQSGAEAAVRGKSTTAGGKGLGAPGRGIYRREKRS